MTQSEVVAQEFRNVVGRYVTKFVGEMHAALGRGEKVRVSYGGLVDEVSRDFDGTEPDENLILEVWRGIIRQLEVQGFIVEERKGRNWSSWNCYVRVPPDQQSLY